MLNVPFHKVGSGTSNLNGRILELLKGEAKGFDCKVLQYMCDHDNQVFLLLYIMYQANI